MGFSQPMENWCIKGIVKEEHENEAYEVLKLLFVSIKMPHGMNSLF